jgi:hypothetical protein
MRMDLAGKKFQVEADYQVLLPPGNHLIVIAGAYLGQPAYDFDHPNVAARKSELFEFKHYRSSGSKFWTSRPGISFYFVLPKAQIELLPEKGYGYVPVLIRGRKCRLGVSGGGGSGWIDYMGSIDSLGCGWSRKGLKLLADIAVSPADCRAQGITLEIKAGKNDEDWNRRRFALAAAAVTMRARLKPGTKVMLQSGYSYKGDEGPLEVISRPSRKRHFVCQGFPGDVRVQSSAIDWLKTAEANGVAVPGPVLVNRIASAAAAGGLLEPVSALE